LKPLNQSAACIMRDLKVEVKGPDGRIKHTSTKSQPMAYLFKRVIISGPDGKVKSDTGFVPSHSFTYQFVRLMEGFLRGSMQAMSDINNVSRTPDLSGSGYDANNYTNRPFSVAAGEDDATYGIVVGTSDTAEANMDYKLNAKIAHGNGVGQLEYSPQSFVTPQVVGAYVNYVLIRSLYNNSGAPITAKEFGIYCKSGLSQYIFCFIRDSDVIGKTVIAGDTMTVQYTLKVGAGFTLQWWQLLGNLFEAPAGSCGPYGSKDVVGTSQFYTMYYNEYYMSGSPGAVSFQINAGDNTDNYGIIVGSGTDAEALTDYKLQTKIAHGAAAGQLDYNATTFTGTAEVLGNVDLILARSYYNATANTIAVRELAWYVLCYRIDYTYHGIAAYFCVIRDLLPGDVNVASDDTLTVQYTLRTNIAI
jgi:hypothetical protein